MPVVIRPALTTSAMALRDLQVVIGMVLDTSLIAYCSFSGCFCMLRQAGLAMQAAFELTPGLAPCLPCSCADVGILLKTTSDPRCTSCETCLTLLRFGQVGYNSFPLIC